MADVLAEIAFLTTAVALLWRGFAEWSLPGGLAARFVAHASVVWAVDRRLPSGKPSVGAARDLRRFAASVLGGRMITVASGNADFILVGRLLGGSALGFYSTAWDLLRFVPDRLHRVVGRVAFPAFCKVQHDDAELGRAYCALISYVSRLVLPIAGLVAFAAPELLTNLYGAQWRPAALPMRTLAFGLALVGLRLGVGAVFYAKGFPSIDIFLNGVRLILIVTAVVASASMGLVAVSASVSAVEAAISIAGQYVVCALISLRFRDVCAATIRGLRATCLCMLAAALGKALGTISDAHGPLLLLFIVIPSALAFLWLEGCEVVQMAIGASQTRRDARATGAA
jgi:PST family polysaccharide transporter